MESSDVYGKLTGIFHQVFDDETIVVESELSADDVDEWDSLTHIRLMLTIEKDFGIKFSASDIGRLKNVGDLVSLIRSKTA